jgi:hypothetical protein
MTSTIEIGAFLAGMAALWFEIRKSRKITFINTITDLRAKHIESLRNDIAKFCSLAHILSVNKPTDELLLKEFEECRYGIMLKLVPEYPEYKEWDVRIIGYLDRIYDLLVNKSRLNEPEKQIKDAIQELIAISQFNLAIEWEGMRLEARKGNISKKRKERLRNDKRLSYLKYKYRNSVHFEKYKMGKEKKEKCCKFWKIISTCGILIGGFAAIGYGVGYICEKVCPIVYISLGVALLVIAALYIKDDE